MNEMEKKNDRRISNYSRNRSGPVEWGSARAAHLAS